MPISVERRRLIRHIWLPSKHPIGQAQRHKWSVHDHSKHFKHSVVELIDGVRWVSSHYFKSSIILQVYHRPVMA
jgi:hypothetical protein